MAQYAEVPVVYLLKEEMSLLPFVILSVAFLVPVYQLHENFMTMEIS